MTTIARSVCILVGIVGVLCAVVVAFYANEVFNIATLIGLAGVVLVVWAIRRPSLTAD